MTKGRIVQHTINKNIMTWKICLLFSYTWDTCKKKSPPSLHSLHDHSRDIFWSSVISVLGSSITVRSLGKHITSSGEEEDQFFSFVLKRRNFLVMKSVPTTFGPHPPPPPPPPPFKERKSPFSSPLLFSDPFDPSCQQIAVSVAEGQFSLCETSLKILSQFLEDGELLYLKWVGRGGMKPAGLWNFRGRGGWGVG